MRKYINLIKQARRCIIVNLMSNEVWSSLDFEVQYKKSK